MLIMRVLQVITPVSPVRGSSCIPLRCSFASVSVFCLSCVCVYASSSFHVACLGLVHFHACTVLQSSVIELAALGQQNTLDEFYRNLDSIRHKLNFVNSGSTDFNFSNFDIEMTDIVICREYFWKLFFVQKVIKKLIDNFKPNFRNFGTKYSSSI